VLLESVAEALVLKSEEKRATELADIRGSIRACTASSRPS
jgi:hypothetical protein